MMDSGFRKWLIKWGHSDLVNCSGDAIRKLRIEYEEEQQDIESSDRAFENFAFYMLGTKQVTRNVTRQWEDWWFDCYQSHDS